MTDKKLPGRKAIDGATERVNVVLTKQHRDRLEQLAPSGLSCWVRAAIDHAWEQHQKGNK